MMSDSFFIIINGTFCVQSAELSVIRNTKKKKKGFALYPFFIMNRLYRLL